MTLIVILLILNVGCTGKIVKPDYPKPVCESIPQCSIIKEWKEDLPDRNELNIGISCLSKQKQILESCINLWEESWEKL